MDPDVVHLQGAVKQTSASGPDANVIGTLPPRFAQIVLFTRSCTPLPERMPI